MELNEETDLKAVEEQKDGERRMSGIDKLTCLTGPAGQTLYNMRKEIPI